LKRSLVSRHYFLKMRAQEQISKEFRLMWAALVASLVWVASGLYLILR